MMPVFSFSDQPAGRFSYGIAFCAYAFGVLSVAGELPKKGWLLLASNFLWMCFFAYRGACDRNYNELAERTKDCFK